VATETTKEQSTSLLTKESERIILTNALNNPHSAVRALVKENLYYFIRYFWDEYSQDEFSPNWHIPYICNELEQIARRVADNKPKEYDLIINVPPGSTKTAITLIMFPLWCWVNWYWMRFITASYTASLSLESAEYSRDILRGEKFKELFPEFDIKQDKDNKSNFRIVKREWIRKGRIPRLINGGNRFSTSVGGSVTGFHGHIILWDDPLDPNRAVSETEIKKANHWMDNTIPFRKVNKKVTPTIGIMQRLHQEDPTGHILKRDDNVRHICLPGEIRNYKDQVKPKELIKKYKNQLLDPKRLDWDVLKEIEKYGQFTYGGQIGQNPIPLGGGMFHTDHVSVRDALPPMPDVLEIVRYWDKAGTKDGDGAYTVGAKVCKLKDGMFVVLDIKRGRWASNDREKIIKETAKTDGTHVKIAIEQEPGSGGKESAEATIKNLAGFSVVADRPSGDKAQRADPFSVQVNNGNVSIMNAGWNKAYLDELENFPSSTFKDQVDASSGAFNKLTRMKKVTVLRRG